MKVNITGKGIIPGLNQLAPVYNQELEKMQVRRILNYPSLKVYGTDGIGLITKNNIDAVFSTKPKDKRPLAATKAAIESRAANPPKVELDMAGAAPYLIPESVVIGLDVAKDPIKPKVLPPQDIESFKPVASPLLPEEKIIESVDDVDTPHIIESWNPKSFPPVTEDVTVIEEPEEEVVEDTDTTETSDDADEVVEETVKESSGTNARPNYNNGKKNKKNRYNNNKK